MTIYLVFDVVSFETLENGWNIQTQFDLCSETTSLLWMMSASSTSTATTRDWQVNRTPIR